MPSRSKFPERFVVRVHPRVARFQPCQLLRDFDRCAKLLLQSALVRGGSAMKEQGPLKLIPRNVAALRRGLPFPKVASTVAGNPMSTRLESGVGNCFPGLEFDLRNLERRFFPFLEVDIRNDENPTTIRVASVDMPSVRLASKAGQLPADRSANYRQLDAGIKNGETWNITEIEGSFGPLGRHALKIADLQLPSAGPRRLPPDPWTAIRLLTEG